MISRGLRVAMALTVVFSLSCGKKPAREATANVPSASSAKVAQSKQSAPPPSASSANVLPSTEDKSSPSEDIVSRIRELAAKPPRQLKDVVGPDEWTILAPLRQRQKRRELIEAYQQFGNKNPTYDGAVMALFERQIEEAGKPRDRVPQTPYERLEEIERIIELGCNDPLITTFHAMALRQVGRYAEAKETLELAVRALTASKYPLSHLQSARRLLGTWYRESHNANACFQQAANEAAVIASNGSFHAGEERLLLEYLHVNFRDSSAWSNQVVQALGRTPGADPWLKNILLGRQHIAKAWEARGSGLASTVTEEGRKGFLHHLTIAGNYLVEAWARRPECPEAAAAMIEVSMGMPGRWGDSPRFWFEQAVAAQFDYLPAYEKYCWSLRPLWRGSYEEMLALGRECLATERFDTEVPWQYMSIVWDIGSEYDDFCDALSLPGVVDDIRRLYERQLALPSGKMRPNFLKTQWAQALLWAGRREEAKALVAELGDHVDHNALAQWRTTWQDMLDDLNDSPAPTPALKTHRFKDAVFNLEFSEDGRWLATDGPKETVLLWDVLHPAGQPLEFDPIQGKLYDLDLSPNGDFLATVTADSSRSEGNAVVFDIKQQKRIATIPFGQERPYGVSFADSDWLITGGTKMAAHLFNWRNGELLASFMEHGNAVTRLGYAPSGRLLTSYSMDGMVKFWELPTPADLKVISSKRILSRSTLRNYSTHVDRFVLSANGKKLAIGAEGRIDVLDTETLRKLYTFPGLQPAFSPDGMSLAVSGYQAPPEIQIWDLQSGRQRLTIRGGHYSQILSLTYSPDGRFIFSGGRDGRIRSWNASTGKADWTWASSSSSTKTRTAPLPFRSK